MKKTRINRALSLIMAVIIIVTMSPLTVSAASLTKVPEGYKGIYTVADLYDINNDLGGYYILMNDIDLSEATAPGGDYDFGNGWEPINRFYGMFDGNGYTIQGMQIFGEISVSDRFEDSVGLFSYVSNGAIHNLVLADCNIDIDVTTNRDSLVIGSLSGLNFGEIKNCFVSGNISVKTDERVIVGGMTGTGRLVDDCAGNMNISVDGPSTIGGIIGDDNDAWGNTIVVNRCYNAGRIEYTAEYGIGGVISVYLSDDRDRQKMVNSYHLKSAVKSNEDSSKPLSSAQMKKEESFIGFDFDETWYIDKYCDYPYPQLISAPVHPIKKIKITEPDESIYFIGDTLDITGGEVEIVYKDGVTVPLEMTMDMLSGYDMDKTGKQKVTVSLLGQTAAFNINVSPIPVQEVQLDKTAYTLNQGSSFTLKATALPEIATNKKITWSSSNKSVAKVSSSGKVTGLKAGTATITAKSASGITKKCKVTVIKSLRPASSIKLSLNELELNKGKAKTLKATVKSTDSTDKIMWFSSNTKVATVSSKGKVAAKGAGTCTITAVTSSGKTSKCAVTVNVPFALSENEIELKKGETYTIKATGGADDDMTYKSMNKTIATVTKKGIVKAVKKGSASIMVVCGDEALILNVTVK